jgi:hypothetical protein
VLSGAAPAQVSSTQRAVDRVEPVKVEKSGSDNGSEDEDGEEDDEEENEDESDEPTPGSHKRMCVGCLPSRSRMLIAPPLQSPARLDWRRADIIHETAPVPAAHGRTLHCTPTPSWWHLTCVFCG